jgi:hypothetical protein
MHHIQTNIGLISGFPKTNDGVFIRTHRGALPKLDTVLIFPLISIGDKHTHNKTSLAIVTVNLK